MMDTSRKKSFAAHGDPTEAGVRRRVSRIIHDDRGNASVDWLDAPSDYKRQVFELEDESGGGLSIQKQPRSFNPYERSTLPEPKRSAAPKKDLRKLSEWIKLMREREEKKRQSSE